MKKEALFIIAVLVCLSAITVANERPPAVDKPFILVNTNTFWPEFHATNQGYGKFAEACRAEGFSIDHRFLVHITDNALEDVDVFILASPAFILDDDDKRALRDFMRRGGGLLVMAYPDDPDEANLNSLLRGYGIWFDRFIIGGRFEADVSATSPLSGPYKCKVITSHFNGDSFYFLGIDPDSAEAVATIDDGSIVAALSHHKFLGKGRLVVAGTDVFPWEQVIDRLDNRAFVLNTMHYLIGSYDLSVVLSKFKGKSVIAGEKKTVIAKVKNIGTKVSDGTKIRFYLSENGTLTGPTTSVATLKTMKLAAIDPDKSKKIKVKVKIPSNIAVGDYYLIAAVDPEGTSKDSDQSNNTKASKKSIEVR